MCQSTFKDCFILKYTDDSVIISLFQRHENDHGLVVDNFVTSYEDSYLSLNTTKTKDMAIVFRKNAKTPEPVVIKGQKIKS